MVLVFVELSLFDEFLLSSFVLVLSSSQEEVSVFLVWGLSEDGFSP